MNRVFKKSAIVISIAGIFALTAPVLLFSSCAPDTSEAAEFPSTPDDLPFFAAAPSAEILWNEILQPAEGDDYTKWKFFPEDGVEFPFKGNELPHGDYVAIYVNEPAFDSLANPSDPFEMKEGSVVIKENYPGTKQPDLSLPIASRDGLLSRTVMWKVRGYSMGGGETRLIRPELPNPKQYPYLVGGDWFFAMYQGKGASRNPSQPVVLIGNQPFLTNNANPIAREAFDAVIGENQAGKPWFCVRCHHDATGVEPFAKQAYGDYIWRVKPFTP